MSKFSLGQNKKTSAKSPGFRPVFSPKENLWLARHPLGRVRLPESAGSAEMKQYLWPDSLDYYNPLNPVVLAQINDIALLNNADSWLVRDGYVGLHYFFLKFPRPKNLKSKLFIHADFGAFVPKSWRSHVTGYSLRQKKTGVVPDKLLICGLACLSGAHEVHRSEILGRLKKEIGGQNLSSKEIYLFMPARHFNFMKEQTFHAELFYDLFRFLPAKINIVNWNFINTQDSFENFLLVNLNPRSIWVDSYINCFVASRGGVIFDVPQVQNLQSTDIQLSNYHGMVTQSLPSAQSDKKDLLKNLSHDPGYFSLPWRNWFKQE